MSNRHFSIQVIHPKLVRYWFESKSCYCFDTQSEMFALHFVPKYTPFSGESKTSILLFNQGQLLFKYFFNFSLLHYYSTKHFRFLKSIAGKRQD